jgi:hypothetical protein
VEGSRRDGREGDVAIARSEARAGPQRRAAPGCRVNAHKEARLTSLEAGKVHSWSELCAKTSEVVSSKAVGSWPADDDRAAWMRS